MFAKHHYLSHSHNKAAHTYVAYVNNQLAGFISILPFPHPKVKKVKRVHRLVILPDFQGVGIGIRLLNFIGNFYLDQTFRYRITTSAPSLINALKKSDIWRCIDYSRKKGSGRNMTNKKSQNINHSNNTHSMNRITGSFELKKIKK